MSAPQHDTTTGVTDRSATAAASGLGRLLALATIYPEGHPRCAEVEEQVIAACQQCGPAQGLVLTIATQGLFASDFELSLDDGNVARLHEALHALAIVSLCIDATVSAEDLRGFVATMQRVKASAQRSTGFSRPDLSDQLPGSIRVAHREFGARLVSESVATTMQGARVAVLQRLRSVASEDQLSAVNDLVTTIVARIVERVEHGTLVAAEASGRGRALDSVLDLCAHAMTHAIAQMLAAGEPLDELGKLVQNVEKAVAIGEDKQSVQELLDVLRLAADEVRPQPAVDHEDDGGPHALTLAQLESQLAALAPDPRPFVAPATERQEQLTILLQLALHAPPPQLLRVATALRACCADDWGPPEFRLLARGSVDFAAQRDVSLVDLFLPTVFELARAVPDDGLRGFLLPLCAPGSAPATRVRLWPHVVNELLHRAGREPGVDQDTDEEDQLWRRLLTIAGSDHDPYLRRLLRLDFVHRGCLSASVLDESLPLRRVLVAVLEHPEGDPLGRHLLQELRQGPVRWPGWQAVFALPRYDSSARVLVQEVLRAGSHVAESQQLQHQSAQILAATLVDLPKDRRGEPWIPEALTALGGLPDAGNARVLAGVLRRRLGLWREWPAKCRRAARQALRHHRASSQGAT